MFARVIAKPTFAEPLKETAVEDASPVTWKFLAVCNVVAVEELPVTLPVKFHEKPLVAVATPVTTTPEAFVSKAAALTSPVTFPVKGPLNEDAVTIPEALIVETDNEVAVIFVVVSKF